NHHRRPGNWIYLSLSGWMVQINISCETDVTAKLPIANREIAHLNLTFYISHFTSHISHLTSHISHFTPFTIYYLLFSH
ncbi:MAG TPA: hypothetical protein PLZ32_06095, partial [Saprospiraceae bacterium]|nr:hypothetical protein [Saprospiraceae bacterium]